MDFMFWLRTKWLDDQLGGVQIGGKKLSDVVDRGLFNAITGADIASRTSLNNLFIREGKEQRDFHSEVAEYALARMGPAPNAIVSMGEGLMALASGDIKKGMQKMSPAGIRNFVTVYNQWQEGAKDNKGTQILTRDAFTAGNLIFQAVGFRSDLLANTQYVNFKVIGLEQRILNDRNNILNKLDREFRDKDFKAFNKTLSTEVNKFNRDFPSYALDSEDITDSITSKQERRATSQRGVSLTEKNVGLFTPVIAPSRKAVIAREKEARQ